MPARHCTPRYVLYRTLYVSLRTDMTGVKKHNPTMPATPLLQAQLMSEQVALEGCIVDLPPYTRVDFQACEPGQIAGLYRILAARLVHCEIRCLLLDYGACSVADHAMLCDVLRMLLRTRERPAPLKLAVLGRTHQAKETVQRLQRDFRLTGIEVRIVPDETAAQAWFSEP